jgi:uncharacterized phiE125 gp8 family phage protein
MPTVRITQPTVEPVTLERAKLHLRVESADEDALISAYISAAREMAEGVTGRAIALSTWEMRTDAFSSALRLDWPSVQSVAEVQFLDPAGELLTLDPQDYELDNASDVAPAWLVPKPGLAWPATAARVNAVRVRYTAGYATPAEVPQPLCIWMLVHVGAMYANREAVGKDLKPLPYLDRLLDPYRVWA